MDDSKVDGDDDVEVKDETDVDDVDLHQVRVGHHVLVIQTVPVNLPEIENETKYFEIIKEGIFYKPAYQPNGF